MPFGTLPIAETVETHSTSVELLLLRALHSHPKRYVFQQPAKPNYPIPYLKNINSSWASSQNDVTTLPKRNLDLYFAFSIIRI